MPKHLIILLFTIQVFNLNAQGSCTYYNKYSDQITVDAKVLPTKLDTNFMKAHVLLEDDHKDSICGTSYSIIEIVDLRSTEHKAYLKRISSKKQLSADWYFMRVCSAAISKDNQNAPFECILSKLGCCGNVLIVEKDDKGNYLSATVKLLFVEI